MVVLTMARRAALQSELSRCEAELRMLGAERFDKPVQVLDNTVSINLHLFANKMFETSEASTNMYAKILLKMWNALLNSLSDEANDYSLKRTPHEIADKINKSVDSVRECMTMLMMAFKDIDQNVMTLCSSAVHGLSFDFEESHGKYIVQKKKAIISQVDFLAYVSSIAEKMCHNIRILYCADNNFYAFLGTEKAKNLMISSFSILDPSHGTPPKEDEV